MNKELIEKMLVDIVPVAPTRSVDSRIWRAVASRLESPLKPRQLVGMRADEGWRPFVNATSMKILSDDGNTMSWLLRMPPGTELPAHRHDEGQEECLVLEGELWVDGVLYRAGDFTIAPRGSTHRRVCTEIGALFYLRSPSRAPSVSSVLA